MVVCQVCTKTRYTHVQGRFQVHKRSPREKRLPCTIWLKIGLLVDFESPEKCLNGPQRHISTPWPQYGSQWSLIWGWNAPLFDLAENWRDCRFRVPEQYLNRPQTLSPSSTPWPLYGSLKVTHHPVTKWKKTPLCDLVEMLDTWPRNPQACQLSAHSHRVVFFLWMTFGDPYRGQGLKLMLWGPSHC
jgi:hypothetical protein